jgi:cyclic pyranopterin phosphate synthase
MSTLVDTLGRHVTYLRMSVTDRCDYRCVYCMTEKMQFLPRAEILTLEEMAQIANVFVRLGVSKIRLTGGEPLIRHGVVGLCENIAKLPGLKELTLTTNASHLKALAQPLYQAGLARINISIDSLHAKTFKEITRVGDIKDVLAGIDAAKQQGFKRIKLNSVIMRNRNDHEILDLVDFARRNEVDISFIEEMPLGNISEHDRAVSMMTSDEVREKITQYYELIPSTEQTGGPSRYWRMKDSDIRLGFISPHSHNFCDTCNRVRLTADGRLLLCLGNEHSADLKTVLRAQGETAVELAIIDAMKIKPARHYFNVHDEPQIVRFMNMTGG